MWYDYCWIYPVLFFYLLISFFFVVVWLVWKGEHLKTSIQQW
jgi:hypothetical protein